MQASGVVACECREVVSPSMPVPVRVCLPDVGEGGLAIVDRYFYRFLPGLRVKVKMQAASRIDGDVEEGCFFGIHGTIWRVGDEVVYPKIRIILRRPVQPFVLVPRRSDVPVPFVREFIHVYPHRAARSTHRDHVPESRCFRENRKRRVLDDLEVRLRLQSC